MEAASLASVAVDKAHNDVLVGVAFALGNVREFAIEGFVNFDGLALAAHWLHADSPHCLAKAMRHEPRGFEGDAKSAMELVGTDALLARRHEKHRLQP